MGRKIVLILGHPQGDSLCAALAAAYQKGAEAAGHEVRRLALGELEHLGKQNDNRIYLPFYNLVKWVPILIREEILSWGKYMSLKCLL